MLLDYVNREVSYETVVTSLPFFDVLSDFDKSVYSSTCILNFQMSFSLPTDYYLSGTIDPL